MDSVTRKKRRSLSADDNFTPRTLIQGFLQTAKTVRQSPRKKARVTPSSTRTLSAADPISAQRRRSQTPRTLPRPAPSSRRRSTRLEIIATPGGSNPTPRGLITGFLQAADVQTPAVHVGTRRSSPLKQPTPVTHRSVLQARAESTNSSAIESPVDEALSRFARPQPREGRGRRQRAIDREEFAARVRDRMGQEETDERREEEENSRDTDTTANRTVLDSIVEEPHDTSLPRPDSTTRDTSVVHASGGGRSSQRSRSRRSLLDNSSFQVPSTSTGENVSAQDTSVMEKRASHPSGSSVEDGSVMDQATQATIQARLSSNTDSEDERRERSRRDEEEDEIVMERLEGTPGGREADAARAEDTDEQEEQEEEEEEDMDLDEDDFDENDLVAPTQSAQLESVKKKSTTASPLNTPHLRDVGRRPTPKAKTPGPFREAAQMKNKAPLLQRAAVRKSPGGRGKRTKEPPSTLPKSLTRSIFSHFSKARVSRDALAVVDEVSGKYFKNLSKDLMAYCKHAGRNTIEQADVELIMKRQRQVSDKDPLNSLIEKYLPLEYREELIPMARSGNKVYPKMPKK